MDYSLDIDFHLYHQLAPVSVSSMIMVDIAVLFSIEVYSCLMLGTRYVQSYNMHCCLRQAEYDS